MNEIVETRAEIGGINTRVLEVAGSGTPLLLLHGFADTADTWRHVLAELARSNRAAVAVDLPGFGQADEPDRSEGFLPPLDRFVAAAATHFTLGGITPVIGGNSLGAVLALRAAQDPAVRPSGAVLISPAGFKHARWVNALARTRSFEPVLLRPGLPMRVVRRLAMLVLPRLLAGSPRRLLPGEAARLAGQLRTAEDVCSVHVGALTLLPETSTNAGDLSPLTAPLMVLWGRKDRLTLVEGASLLEAAYPAAVVERLDGLGHCPQLEDPGLVAKRIEEFLNAVECQKPRTPGREVDAR